jgi:hypothetical protein
MVLSEGIAALKAVEAEIPDPEFASDRQYYENLLRVESTTPAEATSRG